MVVSVTDVYCFEKSTGKFTAHVNPALMGTDVRALKEKDGAPLGQKVFDAAKEGTITTVSYSFPKPGGTDPGEGGLRHRRRQPGLRCRLLQVDYESHVAKRHFQRTSDLEKGPRRARARAK